MVDITSLRGKIENDGATDAGMLRAEEFNTLVKAVIENQDGLKTTIKGVKFKGNEMPVEDGIVIINDSTSKFNVGINWIKEPPKYSAKGSDCIIRVSINNKFLGGDPNGTPASMGATLKFYRNGDLIGTVNDVYDKDFEGNVTKEVEFNIGKYVSDGNNQVYIELDNNQGATDQTQVYTIVGIDISLTVDFDSEIIYTAEKLPQVTVTATGSDASLYINIDGNSVVNGDELTINIPTTYPTKDNDIFGAYNRHGVHTIEIEAAAKEYPDIKTDKYVFDYIYGDHRVLDPVIMSTVTPGSEFEEYSNIVVEYLAYKSGATGDMDVNIQIINKDGEEDLSVPQKLNFVNGTGSNTATVSLFPKDNKSLVGDKTLVITLGDFIHETPIKIIKSSVSLTSVGQYVLYLSSNNKSNNSADKNEWRSEGTAGIITTSFSDNVEFTSAGSGWNKDSDGNLALNIRRGRTATINYAPFATNPCYNSGQNDGTGLGKTISIEFATRNCLKKDASVVRCMSEGRGFEILANALTLSANNTNLTCDFKEDTRIRIDMVIEGKKNKYSYETIAGVDATEWDKNTVEEALMIVFVDGVYQGLRILDGEVNFKQTNPTFIEIGSTDCDIDVYNVRVYDFPLNIDQVIKNYAYDTPRLEDKIAIQQRNNIFTDKIVDTRPEIALNKLQAARPELPLLFVTLDDDVDKLPYNKSDWKYMKYTSFENPMNKDDYAAGTPSFKSDKAQMRNQGTSSMNYPWPWRNWDWKTKKNPFTIGSTTEKKWPQYAGMPGGISKITLKKDYASAEQANNAMCSELFDDMAKGAASYDSKWNGCLSPAQVANGGGSSDYRLALKSIPIFMFHDVYGDKTKLESMGMMNMIPNKNECDYLGFTGGYTWEGARAQSWEVSENHVFWDTPYETTIEYDMNGDGIIHNGIDGNYEARYPKDSTGNGLTVEEGGWGFAGEEEIEADFGYSAEDKVTDEQFNRVYNEQADLLDFHNWVVSTNRACATGEELSSDDQIKYAPHTHDTPAYRLFKFQKEAADHMIIDQWLLYYIWREQYWMFDSGAKNLQLYTMDGTKWGCMVRDADTALGINNVGELMFPPHLEDIDYYIDTPEGIQFVYGGAKNMYSNKELVPLDGNEVLNGQFGAIWLNLRDSYKSRLGELYRALTASANKSKFNAKQSIEKFEAHQGKWCESLYNFGMRQYFGGGAYTANILAGVGDKKNQRKAWLTYGFLYRQSKYKALSNPFSFRAKRYLTPDLRDEVMTIKTYIPMYMGTGSTDTVMENVPDKYHIRITDPNVGASYDLAASGDEIMGYNDKNVYIFGNEMITDIGDMARICKWANVQKLAMPRLTSLRLGDHTGQYLEYYTEQGSDKQLTRRFENSSLSTLNCEELPSLTYLDVTNHRVLTSLNIANNGLLEELYLKGTDALRNLKLPETTTLRVIELGSALNTLTMKGLTGVESVIIEAADKFENITVENCSRAIASESYNWAASSISSGALQSCTVLGAYWDKVNANVLENLLKLGDKLVLTGYMKVNAKISYDLKTRLMTKFGNIDSADNSLHIEYMEEDLTNATLPTRLYLYDLGDTQLTFVPTPSNGNTFVKTEWWIEAGASLYASINPNTGVISVTKVGHEIEDPAEYSYGVKVTLKDGDVIEAEGRICFYQRSCRLGDYVFNDGTYSDELMGNKTPIGICFYIDPKNPANRLMLSLRNLSTTTNSWGLLQKHQYNNTDWDMGGIDGVVLEGDPDYKCYDISKLENIQNVGESLYYYADEDGDGEPEYHEIDTLDDSIYRDLNNESNGYFKEYDRFTMYGDLGWQETMNRIKYPATGTAEYDYKAGSYIPSGLYNTLSIMEHRDKLLSEFDYEVPAKTENSTEMQRLSLILRGMGTSSTGNRHYLLYYPAASYAYAYTPMNDESKLDERFRSHKWFLPAIGDVVRIMYHLKKTDGDDAIFKKAIDDGQFESPYNMWASTEFDPNQACVCPTSGQASGSYKNSTPYIRPICMF